MFQRSGINNSKTCIADLRLILKNQQLEVVRNKKQLHGIQKVSSSTQKRIGRLSEKKVKLKDHIAIKKVRKELMSLLGKNFALHNCLSKLFLSNSFVI